MKQYWEDAGFLKGEYNMTSSMAKLESLLNEISELFMNYSEEELLAPRAPGKWSRQQILGHLVDSALNNLRRFCEIQFLPQPYMVQAYRQNELVDVNQYQDLPLEHLLQLWLSVNRQIIYVVEAMPVEKFQLQVNPQYDNNEMKSLGWIIGDYVEHMDHHRRQL